MSERFTFLPKTVNADTISDSRGIVTLLAAMDIQHINPEMDDEVATQLAGSISNAILMQHVPKN